MHYYNFEIFLVQSKQNFLVILFFFITIVMQLARQIQQKKNYLIKFVFVFVVVVHVGNSSFHLFK